MFRPAFDLVDNCIYNYNINTPGVNSVFFISDNFYPPLSLAFFVLTWYPDFLKEWDSIPEQNMFLRNLL